VRWCRFGILANQSTSANAGDSTPTAPQLNLTSAGSSPTGSDRELVTCSIGRQEIRIVDLNIIVVRV
jgi:hypothetical protein